MLELLWLLLPIAAASGWIAARRSMRAPEPGESKHTPAYFRGLNYLLNEQPDKAIDVFIQMLEVDSETVETHLALGNLFRRRGEVERAIRIHQNLIARPTLSRDQRAQALLELGQDYMRAGLFDRAESLFRELDEMRLYQESALQNLLVIYQQEKDWEKSLEIADRLEGFLDQSLAVERAHFYCEIAEEAGARQDRTAELKALDQALGCDPLCVRATLQKGRLEIDKGFCKKAIETLKTVEHQNAAYLSEALSLLLDCYIELDDRQQLRHYLEHLLQRYPSIKAALALTDLLKSEAGDAEARSFLVDYLQGHPDIEGIDRLISLSVEAPPGTDKAILEILGQLIEKLLDGRAGYRCDRCGFRAKTLHWHCPGCKSWSSIKPFNGVLEDPQAQSRIKL